MDEGFKRELIKSKQKEKTKKQEPQELHEA